MNPLLIVGGFNSYQSTIYAYFTRKFHEFLEKARCNNQLFKELSKYEQEVRKKRKNRDGLTEGIVALTRTKRFLTTTNLDTIEKLGAFDFYWHSIQLTFSIPTGQNNYWLTRINEWKKIHSDVDGLTALHIELGKASDKIIKEKNESGLVEIIS